MVLDLIAYGSGTVVLLIFATAGYVSIRVERYLRHKELDKRTGVDRK